MHFVKGAHDDIENKTGFFVKGTDPSEIVLNSGY